MTIISPDASPNSKARLLADLKELQRRRAVRASLTEFARSEGFEPAPHHKLLIAELEAALAAGETRLRPVLMTAGAMFVGLIPMALGLGDGSEQNAALARAVMGGVLVGTCSTLLFVPLLYRIIRRRQPQPLENYL